MRPSTCADNLATIDDTRMHLARVKMERDGIEDSWRRRLTPPASSFIHAIRQSTSGSPIFCRAALTAENGLLPKNP